MAMRRRSKERPMNILAINGSPKGKRSNTWRLTSAFLEGIVAWEENGRKQAPAIETLSVSALDIKPCLGCFSCWSKTPGKCCIHDDMRAVIEKILWADVIIWSFPLYYFGLPGQLKNLIDRQLPMSLPFMSTETESGGHPSRYDMSGKRTVVVSTCGFYTAKGNYGCVTSLFDRLCGKDGYAAIFCGQGELFRVKELANRTDEYLSWVRKAGEEFASGEISTETRGKLDRSLFPRDVFEAMADASWGVGESGEKEDPSLVFTRQMAALYRKQAWPGRDIVLDMNYTDIGNTYRIVLGESGSRLETEPAEGFSSDFTTRINTPLSVWRSIASGEIAGDEALMQHLYSVEGDFDLMMHWDDYFGAASGADVGETDAGESGAVADGGPAVGAKANKPKTNMLLLLTPWIVFWIAAAVDGFWGSLVSIGVCVLLPVLMRRTKATAYDQVSAFLVSACSIALLVGASPALVIPVSYLLFGLMWTVSCFLKVPLTAHYSKNSYNGEAALRNPIFMRTNRILTAAWGVLYLITPIWTCFIMQTDAASFVGAINSILPALMGVFTAWFQKWYPRHIARG
ncbi:NAD(P)H-dependent oxidoreductase [Senegalimassilia anaerobia]|uniref:NAD(P)H-dependent oxidoreductase n=1 Tax=Senegalimassilia anaerobia TaxID=1473216 RepID=UPI003AACF628